MQFVHQILSWGFLLALVPLLIHLINLVRHERVRWAAMEFLLASYKKHRRWVQFKQFLLLLSRMAATALLVMMCAQWITADQWLNLFGGKATHHFIVVDDSYSMSERTGGVSAFDQALQTVTSLIAEADDQDTEHRITLVRASRAVGYGTLDDENEATASIGEAVDLNAETIGSELKAKWDSLRSRLQTTELAIGPREAIGVIQRLVDPAANEHRLVYLLSDFRAKDWSGEADTREVLHDLQRNKCDLHFIDCGRKAEPNLTLVDISPDVDLKAAGVPMFVNIQVRNQGDQTLRRVAMKVRSLAYAAKTQDGATVESAQTEELPTILIDQIGPGETISRRAQVFFPQAGKHAVEAILPDDCVLADNRRWCVIDVPEGRRALVIDGSDEQYHAYYLTAAFRPLERSNTGIRADVKPASFLQDITSDALKEYAGVFLLDVPRLERKSIDNLTRYVEAGGGLAIFTGDKTNAAFYNDQLFAEGQGLLPLPLGVVRELPPADADDLPDFQTSDHPVFSIFQGERNSFLAGVTIQRFLSPRSDWEAKKHPEVKTLATLRTGEPLFVEKSFGDGVVILCTSTAAPLWNDWAKNPSFVVLALKLQSYLTGARRDNNSRVVGDPLLVALDAAKYLPEVSYRSPGPEAATSVETQRKAVPQAGDTAELSASLGRNGAGRPSGLTDRSGIYEAATLTLLGASETQRFALNVDPAEGALVKVESRELADQLAPVQFEFHTADQMGFIVGRQAGYNRSLLTMAVLIALLIAEQALAYSASYHPLTGALR